MILAKAKMTFTPALALSLLLHSVLLFSLFPKAGQMDLLTDDLSFERGRIVISSILMRDAVQKKVPSAPSIPKENTIPLKPVKKQEIVAQEQSSVVRSFEKSIIKNTPPTYPRVARKRGWQGDVELLIHVSAKGIVKKIDILKSNAHIVLKKSAVKSARSWLFNPSENQLPYQVRKTIKFQLK
jgi:TonB family protein